jgi:VWFA-related protein
MTRLGSIVALGALLLSHAQAQIPTFSARVEGVRVDVLVTGANRRPVLGLTPADFDVRDNGVAQQVDVVSFGEIPLSVSLAFDLSESVAGDRLEQLQRASESLTSALRREDEVALVTFDRAVTLRCPSAHDTGCVRTALMAATPAGETALVDGTYTGLVLGESDVGRSLLMVFSDGIDTASYLTAEQVLATARRSDVVAYGISPAAARSAFLKDLTSLTGGRLYETDPRTDLAGLFQSVLDEFRHRYLVTYTPRGVSRDGWHKLEVKLKRGGAAVKARPGYQGQ